ncbi:uncharacterized protein I303_102087 [Kwoniella dejecticola CBS 10117]|uniref:Uncharacterized protein n=1 Tax=Kwoniella dejecticola CBS 10117 TaxID=1296121 RepID=A0A1A6ABX9_9TREE|nr:uncharacterized protein I303_01772 [Kwoniella dejecticola CBS 10117]OBR87564.1 hypothetical protein I303_01772 [Kwoniella dejecticola CBS 10117]
MAPKRPLKRRGEEDDRRQSKKPGKNKREITYDTYDEALDGGVEMEEKGERYKDGDKSQRFYERAVELYEKALGFQETYDAAYNQARVLYTLSTSFLLPPSCLKPLRRSIELYRSATSLTNSPLLRMDVAFNLSQSCSSLADILEDLDGDGNLEEVRKLRIEARDVLQEVMDGQEEYLRATSDENDADETGNVVDEIEDRAEAAATGESMDVDPDDDNEDGVEGEVGEEGTFETHLPTPSTYIDTVITLIDIHLSLWTSTAEPQTPIEEDQLAVRSILDRAAVFAPPGRQAELDLAEVKVLLSMDSIIWDIYKSQAQPNMGLEKSLEGAIAALTAILTSLDVTPPEEATVKPEILTTLADTHIVIANRMIFLNKHYPPGPSPLAQQAWYHLSSATTHLNTALELPTSAFTPREFRPSVLLSLSKASLSRARLSSVHETAKRNVVQLMDNANTYAARAGEGLGWKFMRFEGSVPTSTGLTLSIGGGTNGKDELPWQAGWESELLARNTALQQVRNCIYAAKTELLPQEDRTKYLAGLKKVLDKLKVQQGERALGSKDVERFLLEVEDDEGAVNELEKGWWKEIFAA